MLPFDSGVNLCLSSGFPSFLFHLLNCGSGFPSALQLMMPDMPLMRVCCGLSLVNRAVKNNIPCFEYIHRNHKILINSTTFFFILKDMFRSIVDRNELQRTVTVN